MTSRAMRTEYWHIMEYSVVVHSLEYACTMQHAVLIAMQCESTDCHPAHRVMALRNRSRMQRLGSSNHTWMC